MAEIYRVKVVRAKALQPDMSKSESTNVMYCGQSREEALRAYYRDQPSDCKNRKTILEMVKSDEVDLTKLDGSEMKPVTA